MRMTECFSQWHGHIDRILAKLKLRLLSDRCESSYGSGRIISESGEDHGNDEKK